MESLQAAVSAVIENPKGHNFTTYARRPYIVYLNKAKGKRAEKAFQWKLEPLATSSTKPARRSSFLEYWLSTCNPCPGVNILVTSCGGLYLRERSWAPVESLISRLNHLEQLDFITDNEFATGLEQALFYYHPNCAVNIIWRQSVAYSVLDRETTHQLNPHDLFSDYEFDINVLRLPGLHSLAVNIVYNRSRVGGREAIEEVLPFLVRALGLQHPDL